MKPRVLKIELDEKGYYMEVDVRRDDCLAEDAHWHVCKDGHRIGQLSVPRCIWVMLPENCPIQVIKEAEKLTHEYAEEVESIYKYNRLNGAS